MILTMRLSDKNPIHFKFTLHIMYLLHLLLKIKQIKLNQLVYS